MAGGRRRGGSGRRGGPRQHPVSHEPAPVPSPLSPAAATAQRNTGAAPKTSHPKKTVEEPAARAPDVDSLGFQAMDSNVPGLSHVILQKLNMKTYEDYKSAMDGRKSGSDFGIRTYFDMFQKMEDTFKFCAECKKLPDALPDPKSLRRCKRCQNVYYCGVVCQRANWPLHKKFCKKLKLVALDRLVEWLVFTGDIPFPSENWTKPAWDVESWEDWFAMQGQLEEKLGAILAGRYMTLLWANAGKPRPEDGELRESIRRLVTDFHSRPLTIGLGLRLFSIDPLAKALTVHVVGASHVETLNTRLTDYDELTRMFPGHRGMELVMVGVDVVNGPIMRPPLATPAPRGRVYLSSYKGLYHDFWESHVETKLAARPDLVVGFHPVPRRFPCLPGPAGGLAAHPAAAAGLPPARPLHCLQRAGAEVLPADPGGARDAHHGLRHQPLRLAPARAGLLQPQQGTRLLQLLLHRPAGAGSIGCAGWRGAGGG
ncbi:putative protein MSS51 homolog, mitochondrial isoform X2 [Strix uralensis]|uniref:putative protein MSS51 homolog, mitochondrial isoform X2 n=1 Tax=Strix uralensis TaxID=36305 RepID=UPI003DA36CBF